jgi:hypothetical protein
VDKDRPTVDTQLRRSRTGFARHVSPSIPGAASFFKLRWAMRGILIVDDFPSEVWLAADVARNLGVSKQAIWAWKAIGWHLIHLQLAFLGLIFYCWFPEFGERTG